MPITISIITATYNRADTISQCLDSVENQSYLNREHVVIDGASTDGTLQILQSPRARISALVSEPDRGIYDALNKGVSMATGDVIGLLHADDSYASDQVLGTVVAAFENPKVQAVYGDLQYVSRADLSRMVCHWLVLEFARERLC